MIKEGFAKRDYSKGPYPEPHSVGEERLPPFGTYEPKADTTRPGPWAAEHAIGTSKSGEGDFSPYVHYSGEGLFHSFSLDFPSNIPFALSGIHPHVGLMLFTLAFNCRPDVVIETGTNLGYSTQFLAKACELWGSGKVYTIDPEQDRIHEDVKNNPYIECIKGLSDTALPELCEKVKQVDFVFLDSWKRLALNEFSMVEPFVVDGGIVAFHDTQFLNSGHTLYDIIDNNFPGWDKMLFCGTPHKENPHRYTGHVDDVGLYVLRKREENPFLDVPDFHNEQHGDHQVAPYDRQVRDYANLEVEGC